MSAERKKQSDDDPGVMFRDPAMTTPCGAPATYLTTRLPSYSVTYSVLSVSHVNPNGKYSRFDRFPPLPTPGIVTPALFHWNNTGPLIFLA
jgi:hypothetical protein